MESLKLNRVGNPPAAADLPGAPLLEQIWAEMDVRNSPLQPTMQMASEVICYLAGSAENWVCRVALSLLAIMSSTGT